MWIRTKRGEIFKEEDSVKRTFGSISFKIFQVKKQGDNLIDVLEVGDIITSNLTTDETLNIISSIDERGIRAGMAILFTDTVITKVITHEQYMPLAQEVK